MDHESKQNEAPKSGKKYLHFLWILLLGSLLLLSVLLPSVQTFLANRFFGDYLLSKNFIFHTAELKIKPNGSISLKNAVVSEVEGDTLFYLDEFFAKINRIHFKPHFGLELDSIFLNQPINRINYSSRDSSSNLSRFINIFSSDSVSVDTTPTVFRVTAKRLHLEDGEFLYWDGKKSLVENQLDFNHLHLKNINFDLQNTFVSADSMSGDIVLLQLNDRSGLQIRELYSNLIITDSIIQADGTYLHLNEGDVFADFVLEHKEYNAFSNFIEEVRMHICINNSFISSSDLAYFVPELHGLDEVIDVSGIFKGRVSAFALSELNLAFLDGSFLKGNAVVRGLPDINETFLMLKLDELSSNYNSLSRIPLPPFSEKKKLAIPNELKKLEMMKYSGSITGFIDDFVAYGKFETNLGNLETDVHLYSEGGFELSKYRGEIKSNGLDIGKFLGDYKNLNNTAFNFVIEGKNFDVNNLEVELVGKIDRINYLDYNYKKVNLSGQIKRRTFNGEISFKDKNGLVDFDGKVDFSSELPEMDFNLLLSDLNLQAYNLIKRDTTPLVSGEFNLKLAGNSVNNIVGIADFRNIFWREGDIEACVDSIIIEGRKTNGQRTLEIKSDLANLYTKGTYNTATLYDAVTSNLANAFPSLLKGVEIKPFEPQNFVFRAQVYPNEDLNKLFISKFILKETLQLEGSLDTEKKQLQFDLSTERLQLDKLGMARGISIRTSLVDNVFGILGDVERISLTDTVFVENISILTKGLGNNLQVSTSWENQGRFSRYDGSVNALVEVLGPRKLGIKMLPSNFSIGDSSWEINSMGLILLDTQSVFIPKLTLANSLSSVEIKGDVNKSKSEGSIDLKMNRFDLNLLNVFFPDELLVFKGLIDGNVNLENPLNKPIFRADLEIEKLEINNQEIGDGRVISNYDNQKKQLQLDANLSNKFGKNLKLNGFYYPENKSDALAMNLSFAKFELKTIEPFISDYVDNLSGNFKGDIDISGNLQHPILKGKIFSDTLGLRVDYLNTYYKVLPSRFFIDDDMIGFNYIPLRDVKNNAAFATGTILHDNFTNFNLNISLETKKFQLLNTTLRDNELYYGSAYATGFVSIDGYADLLDLQVTATTNKGTQFNLPISSSIDVQENSFITFRSFSDTSQIVKEEISNSYQGINISFTLDVTDDAEALLIFDETVGDVMRVRGNGNLISTIDADGSFQMYGDLEISEGDYLFTLQNVINRKFVVDKGSRIVWNGDPLEANLDIVATYKTRTSIGNLGLSLDSSTNNARTLVELKMIMKNSLSNPDITFDIQTPTLAQETRDMISAAITTEAQLNRQVFSLLLLSRFASLNEGVAGGDNAVGSNSFELINNQLSNWMSQFSDKFDFGVDYRMGNEQANLNQEISVAVSTQLLNDRMIIDGSFGSANDVTRADQNANALVGDFMVQYLISENGKFRTRVYNKSNDFTMVNANTSLYTQGAGLSYREEFSTWKEFFSMFKRKSKKNK